MALGRPLTPLVLADDQRDQLASISKSTVNKHPKMTHYRHPKVTHQRGIFLGMGSEPKGRFIAWENRGLWERGGGTQYSGMHASMNIG